jgi:sugar phosphate isomerase/epimerase
MSKFILSAFGDEIDLDLKKQMDVLEMHNISHIEMRGINGKNIVEYTLDEVKAIKRQLDLRNFKVSSIGSPVGKIGIIDNFAPDLELFKHTLEIAKIMDTKYVRLFSFYIPQGDDPYIYRDEVMYRWFRYVEEAKGSELVLLHENEKEIYGDTAERCLDILNTINCDYVKAVFDIANFVQCNVKTYPGAYELLKNYIAYIHIKDAFYSGQHVVPSGYGEGKVKEILTSLYNDGYEGFLSLEPHLSYFEGLEKLETSTKLFKGQQDDGEKFFSIAHKALVDIISNSIN